MTYSIIQTIMLLGAVQGFIFSGFAFVSKKYRSRANFFLGMLILTFSYNILQNYLVVSGLISSDAYFHFFYIPFTSVFLVLFYLYVRSFLYPKKKLNRAHYLLFLPFLIVFSESVFEKIGFATGVFTMEHNVNFNDFRFIQEIFNVAYTLLLIVLSYLMILDFERKQSSPNNRKIRLQLKWLKTITIILFCLGLYWILPLYYELQMELDVSKLYFYPLWLGLTITIYSLGHIGLYQFGIVEEQKSIRKYSLSRPSPIPASIVYPKNDNLIAFEKYVKTEKNYLNANLTLEAVADSLEINKSYLSRIINSELNRSFSDYVNELRVEEAKDYLNNPEFVNYTLIAIGMEAGFNSKSTFNSTFKKFTGLTPSEYKLKLLQNA